MIHALSVFTGVFILGTIVIVVIVFRYLAPRTSTWHTDAPSHARCYNCGKPIRGCRHHQGVASAWVHVGTGLAYCERGLGKAEHR